MINLLRLVEGHPGLSQEGMTELWKKADNAYYTCHDARVDPINLALVVKAARDRDEAVFREQVAVAQRRATEERLLEVERERDQALAEIERLRRNR